VRSSGETTVNTKAQRTKQEIVMQRLKVVVVGAHPDDPETLAGGTMYLLAQAGHEVVAAYLTRGEAGIPGTAAADAAHIRTVEALQACEILGVRPVFLGQVDGACEVTRLRYDDAHRFLDAEAPDVVFTHWPIDTHRDHRVCSTLVYDAWQRLAKRFALYYGEVMTGQQTQDFHPTDYVDISKTVETKHAACFAHVSQRIRETYDHHHGTMEVYRGMEACCAYAEAFIHQVQSPRIRLP
jgi:LmbE family N-acetylglucosaminyl deacetylase